MTKVKFGYAAILVCEVQVQSRNSKDRQMELFLVPVEMGAWILGNYTVIALCIPFVIYNFFVELSEHILYDWLYTYSIAFLST